MSTFSCFFVAAFAMLVMLSGTEAIVPKVCNGVMKYNVTFYMHWTRSRFGSTVPSNAMISPLTAAAHMSRFSPFAPYSYATKDVEMVAESGNNAMLIKALKENSMVGSVGHLSEPTSNVGPASVMVTVDGRKGFTHVSAIAMLAPTPDWIAFFNNIDVCRYGWWARSVYGKLYGWDAGTEKTMGVDQQPRQNIYRLQKPRYPTYQKYPVGTFTIRKMEN